MIEVAGYQVMFVEWTLVIITFLLLCLRIYARLNLKSTILTWNDLFAVLSWVSFLTAASLDTTLYRHGYFDGDYVPTVSSLKIEYVDGGNYFWGPYAAKASMLCFFTELVPRTMKRTRALLWFTAALTLVGFMATEGILLFGCHPLSTNWSLDENVHCSAGWTVPGYVVPYVFHLITDLLLYTIPILVVRAVRLPSNQKIAVGVTFALGFLCVAFAIAVIAASWTVDNLGFGWIFGSLEQSWAVVIVCAPSFKYFISKWDSSSRSGTVIRKVGSSWVISNNKTNKSGRGYMAGNSDHSNPDRSFVGGNRSSRMKTNISTTDSRAVFRTHHGSGDSEEELNGKDGNSSNGIVVNRTVEIELEDGIGMREKDLEGGSFASVPSNSKNA